MAERSGCPRKSPAERIRPLRFPPKATISKNRRLLGRRRPIRATVSDHVPGYEKTFLDAEDDPDPAVIMQVLRERIRWFQDRAIPGDDVVLRSHAARRAGAARKQRRQDVLTGMRGLQRKQQSGLAVGAGKPRASAAVRCRRERRRRSGACGSHRRGSGVI